jgi:hypothetical protein
MYGNGTASTRTRTKCSSVFPSGFITKSGRPVGTASFPSASPASN